MADREKVYFTSVICCVDATCLSLHAARQLFYLRHRLRLQTLHFCLVIDQFQLVLLTWVFSVSGCWTSRGSNHLIADSFTICL